MLLAVVTGCSHAGDLPSGTPGPSIQAMPTAAATPGLPAAEPSGDGSASPDAFVPVEPTPAGGVPAITSPPQGQPGQPGQPGAPTASPTAAGSVAEATPAGSPSTAGCAPAPQDLASVPVLSRGSRERRAVALTFDDGWDAANTGRILDTLRSQRVNATFFPTGWSLAHLPGLWRQVAAAGFPIGNHTADHLSLAGRCYDEQLGQLMAFDAEARTLGITPWAAMRPPSASYDVTTRLAASGAGQAALVLWDVDTRDWTGASASTVTSRALAGREGSIVLMHTFPAATASALPRIIAGYRARGFTFVTVGQLLGLGGPVPYPPGD